jgi:DNA-binding MarR family transcriptional regulator
VNPCASARGVTRDAHSQSSATRAADDAGVGTRETVLKAVEAARGLKGALAMIETLLAPSSQSGAPTLAHALILVNLSRARTRKQSDLHAATGIAAGYLTRLIDDLDEAGMVHRRRCTRDRRQILLSLTDQGRDMARSLLAGLDQPALLEACDQLISSLERFRATSTKLRR